MKLKFFIAVFALLSAVTIIQAQTNENSAGGSFKVSSLNDGFFAFVGDFEGNYQVFPERIEVEVTRGKIILRDVSSYRGQRELKGLSVGLAATTEKRWKIACDSEPLKIDKVMTPDTEYQIENTKFIIPKDPAIDLSQHWLVFTMSGRMLDRANPAENQIGTAYAHSSRNIFGGNKNPVIAQREDCIPYNVRALRIVDEGALGWLLTDGNSRMLGLDNEADAKAALALAKKYTQHCFIGRGNKRPNRKDYIVHYWK